MVPGEREKLRQTLQAERLAAVRTLVSGLAHEIRNPLNAAQLQLDVLESRVERGQTDEASLLPVVVTVRDELRRLGNLLNDLLSFARPPALELSRVDLNGLLKELAESERTKADGTGVAVELELDPAAGQVEVDAKRIREAVGNLVENAIEAAGRGGRVWLRSRAADGDGLVSIEIEDDGPGFPAGAAIFDVFYSTKPEGTGLGLPIAHRTATDHGGTLRGAAAGGRTRFVLKLPRDAG
jgi:signal transduction histidine kinase